jgi:hypothetical protein
VRAAGNISEGFVDGNALDQRGEIVEDVDDRIAEPLVVAKMAADKNELRTKFARPEGSVSDDDGKCRRARRRGCASVGDIALFLA